MSKSKMPTESAWHVDPRTGDLVDPDDAPELTGDWFEKADLHVGGKLVRRGRPKGETSKVQVTLRVDPDIVAAFKATGPGWQTRMNSALRRAKPKGPGPERKRA